MYWILVIQSVLKVIWIFCVSMQIGQKIKSIEEMVQRPNCIFDFNLAVVCRLPRRPKISRSKIATGAAGCSGRAGAWDGEARTRGMPDWWLPHGVLNSFLAVALVAVVRPRDLIDSGGCGISGDREKLRERSDYFLLESVAWRSQHLDVGLDLDGLKLVRPRWESWAYFVFSTKHCRLSHIFLFSCTCISYVLYICNF
jgi:hypothetical protein